MAQAAKASHANTRLLIEKLTAIEGVEAVFNSAVFHECVLRIDTDLDELVSALSERGIIAGKTLNSDYAELKNCLLICATELRTEEEMDDYAMHLEQIISR